MPETVCHYKCKYCKQKFPTFNTCLEHECSEHLQIDIPTYHQWQTLKDEVRRASHIVSTTKNAMTEQIFDDTINKLIAFENKYNLSKQQ